MALFVDAHSRLFGVCRFGAFSLTERAFITIVTILDVSGMILTVLAITYAGSGWFEGEGLANSYPVGAFVTILVPPML